MFLTTDENRKKTHAFANNFGKTPHLSLPFLLNHQSCNVRIITGRQ